MISRSRVLAAVLVVLAGSSPVAGQQIASIKTLRGDVTFRPAGSTAFAAAKAGQALAIGDFLATDVDSEAVLGFPEGAEVKVSELSQVRVNEMFLAPDRNRLQLFLRTGRVETSTPPQALSRTGFSVATPVATASIRGSHQLVTHQDGFGTHVEFLSGSGFTSTPSSMRVLQAAGQKSQVSASGGLSGPLRTSKRASRPSLMSEGHDDSEQSNEGDGGESGGLGDRTSNDPSNPTKLGNSVASSSGSARLRLTIERVP
jgi:hypothetical protein